MCDDNANDVVKDVDVWLIVVDVIPAVDSFYVIVLDYDVIHLVDCDVDVDDAKIDCDVDQNVVDVVVDDDDDVCKVLDLNMRIDDHDDLWMMRLRMIMLLMMSVNTY